MGKARTGPLAQISARPGAALTLWADDGKPGLILLMEGADPIIHVRDLPKWSARGLRMIGLTYGDTRYGNGVGHGSSTYKQRGVDARGVHLA